MPNWVEGTFRVRGSKEKIINFIEGALKPVDGGSLDIEKLGDMFYLNKSGDMMWLDETRRQFVETTYIEPFEIGSGEYAFVCGYEGAWRIDTEGISALSEKYGVRIKVNGYEMGTMFEEIYDVSSGEEIVHTVTEYEKLEDWLWNCSMPRLGG